jgi:NAD(P)-dependent dehydrogenase (short-subunit alcohol dehydrogenase family)
MDELKMAVHPDEYAPAALVSGGAVRIGRAIALDLADLGWAVAVHYNRSESEAREVVAEIESRGGRATAIEADFNNEKEVQALVPRAVAALGQLGCLINNASIFERDLVSDATRDSWDRHLEPNLRAPFVLTQGFAAALPADAGGMVVNLLDERVWDLPPDYVSYTLSKSGLWTLTRTMAMALAPRVRVNAIGPGYAVPERGKSLQDYRKAVAALPLGRSTSTEEICATVRFLLATKSITGQMIVLDGGQHCDRRLK